MYLLDKNSSYYLDFLAESTPYQCITDETFLHSFHEENQLFQSNLFIFILFLASNTYGC